MKKPSISFDKQAVQEFCIQHVEKFVFGLFVFFCLMLIYKAIGRESFERAPEELGKLSSDVETRTNNTTRQVDKEVREYVPKVRDVVFETGPFPNPINPNPVPELVLRGDPPLSSVAGLRVHGENGPINRQDSRSGSSTRGYRWAVVTGVVSFDAQQQEWDEFFKDCVSHYPDQEKVNYYAYLIDRAEIKDPTDLADPKWSLRVLFFDRSFTSSNTGGRTAGATQEDLELLKGDMPQFKYLSEQVLSRSLSMASGSGEIEERFLNKALTFPLLQLAFGRTWGEEVAHAPEIPLYRRDQGMGEMGMGEGGMGEGGMVFGVPAGENDPSMAEDDEPAMFDPDAARQEMMDRGTLGEQEVTDLLFRYLDLFVEPGKQYVYRVALIANNPNYKVPGRELADVSLANKFYKVSGWSEVSPVVTIPRDARVLPGPIRKARRPGAGDTLTVLTTAFEPRTGIEVSWLEEKVATGQMLNFYEREGVDTTRSSEDANAFGGGRMTREFDEGGREVTPDVPKFDFVTNALLLDMMGGDVMIPKRVDRGPDTSQPDNNTPTEILILDEDGQLAVLDEVELAEQYRRRMDIIDVSEDDDDAGSEFEFDGGMDGEIPFFGEER